MKLIILSEESIKTLPKAYLKGRLSEGNLGVLAFAQLQKSNSILTMPILRHFSCHDNMKLKAFLKLLNLLNSWKAITHRLRETLKMNKINKNMLISDIISQYPETMEVFLEYGLHCVTCHVSNVETLEQGAKRHGMDEQKVEHMIKDANQTIEENFKSLVEEKAV